MRPAAGLAVGAVAGLQLHGTGTSLGDPIEVGAASGLLLDGRPASQPFSLMASKSALGHSEPASGIMGLASLYQVGEIAGRILSLPSLIRASSYCSEDNGQVEQGALAGFKCST